MKAGMIVVGIVSIVIGLLLMFMRGVFTTKYAPQFSEEKFQRIRVGDTMERVIGELGEPLTKRTNRSFVVWNYTEGSGLGAFWKCRQVIISNDVIRKINFRNGLKLAASGRLDAANRTSKRTGCARSHFRKMNGPGGRKRKRQRTAALQDALRIRQVLDCGSPLPLSLRP